MTEIIDWTFTGTEEDNSAPFIPTPERFRTRVATFVPTEAKYTKPDGTPASIDGPHYIVHVVVNGEVQDNPSHIPQEDFEETHTLPAHIDGPFETEKLAGVRAAVYLGPPTRLATNLNATENPDTWPVLNPGDVVAIGTDTDGKERRTKFRDGSMHPDQYPMDIHWTSFVFGTPGIPTVTGPESKVTFYAREQLPEVIAASRKALSAAQTPPAASPVPPAIE